MSTAVQRLAARPRAALGAGMAAVVAASALLSYHARSWPSDYPGDAGDPINALIHGHLHEFLAARPAMGPLSLILRAPFAALSLLTQGPDPNRYYNDAYRFGVFPCLVIAGLLGLWLAKIMLERRQPLLAALAVAALCVINPGVAASLRLGHPEEILGGAFVCAGLVFALRGRPWLALLLVALTVANKQWGVLVVLPVALALEPRHLRRGAGIFAAVAAVLAIPLLAVDAGSLWASLRQMLDIRGTFVLAPDVWFPFTHHSDPAFARGHNSLPAWMGLGARPILIGVCLLVPLVLARRARRDPLHRVPAVLALVLLLRCMLDPLDNSSYHEPFLLAVITADALSGTLLPTLVAVLCLQLSQRFFAISPAALCAFYLSWTVPLAVYYFARAWGATVRIPGVRGLGAAPRAHPSAAATRTPEAR